MNISIELPDEIASQLGRGWDDLPRRALEALVSDACRDRLLSPAQAQAILGLRSRWEIDDFLSRSGVHLDYTEDDLDADIETLDSILGT